MNDPQICIPKTGNTLIISIHKTRFLIGIGPLLLSSISGLWWNRRRKYKLWGSR